MCARYGSAAEFNLLHKTYRVDFPPIIALPKEIIYPHTPAPVILNAKNGLELRLMNYSLIPAWSKFRKPKFVTYNARIEEVLNKPSWKEPFISKHCLVPVQSFIESVYTGRFAGHNINITAKDNHLLTAAGIWDSWRDASTGEVIESFAILTGEPPEDILEAGHDRCPIFLREESMRNWLDLKENPKAMVEWLKQHRDIVDFGFEEREAIKSYTGQLSLLGDE